MSSPTREDSTLSDPSSPGVEMQNRSTVAKLKRLASDPKYQKPDDTTQADHHDGTDDDTSAIAVSAGEAANKLSSILRRPSASHADIRRFIEKEYHKSSAARELARHIILLIIIIAGVTLHRSAYESFLMNQALTTTFVTEDIDSEFEPFSKDFKDIGQPDEFVGWFLSVLGGNLDQTTFYNDQNMTEEEQNNIMFSNRLIGGVRLRQLRVAPNRGCYKPNQLKSLVNGTCYAYSYSASTRDTKPFGPPEDPTRYTYQSEKETGSVGVFGYVLDYLDGGGYVVDVNIEDKQNGTTYTEAFQQLLDDLWIDRQTRAVIISMTFLNLELDSRIAVMYLIIEIPGNGVFFPNYMIKTFRLNMYVSPLDYFRLFLEIMFVLFVMYSIYCEGCEMINNHRTRKVTGRGLKKYFYNGWNIIELVDIALYLTVIILYAKYLASPERYEAKLDITHYSSDMERLAAIALGFYNVCAFNVIITTFRTFKYLKLNHRLYLLWRALRHAGLDLIGFLFIFLIFIFGFIFMGWLSFGADIMGFSTFFRSFSTCWNFIIGNAPDYDEMFASNRILGPTFFVLFTIFIFFILANMFIAILSNSFDVVSENNKESAKLKDVFEEKIAEVASALKKFYYGITKRDAKRRPITEILDNLANPDILDQPNLTRDDVANAIGPGATEMEIEDLHSWVKKLEARKQGRRSKAGGTVGRGSGAGLMAEYDQEEEAPPTTRSLMKGDATAPPSSPSSSDSQETKAAIREMQAQMLELKQLIHRLSPNRDSNNNND